MQKTLYFLAFVLLYHIQVIAQSTNGLVARWAMNGNLRDTSGNAHHGIGYNITSDTGINGLPNTAYKFTGAPNSYVAVPPSSGFNLYPKQSLCAVIKPTGFYGGSCQGNFIVFRGVQGSAGSFGLLFFDGPYNDCSTSDTNKYVFGSNAGSASPTTSQWQNDSFVHTSRWYKVVATFDGTTYRIYVNGSLTKTIPGLSTSNLNISDSLSIGKYLPGGTFAPYSFKGLIDDIRVYNRVLADTEATQYDGNNLRLKDTAITVCLPGSFNLAYYADFNYNAGNNFTVQLSDAAGSFASPVSIGSVAALASGSITCTLPVNITPGNGYKLRLIASSPAEISLPIKLTVGISQTTSLQIQASTGSNICPNTQVVFTATSTGGGATPVYQWKKNSQNVGTNSITYTDAGINNSDVITCTMTTSATCATPVVVNATPIAMTVFPIPTPSISITASPDTQICFGTPVNFSAIPVNGGSNPQYQWKLNGMIMGGAIASIYTIPALNDGDYVSCEMTSNAVCVLNANVASNVLNFKVTPSTPPTANISSNKGSVVIEGDTVTFTSSVGNGGTAPIFTWRKNGVAIQGATSANYTTNDLHNNDTITLVVHSSQACAVPDSVVSSSIVMTVIPAGVEDLNKQLYNVRIYPNPNNGTFRFEAALKEFVPGAEASYEILNNVGQTVASGKIDLKGSNKFVSQVTLPEVTGGTYFIRVSVGQHKVVCRFTVQ